MSSTQRVGTMRGLRPYIVKQLPWLLSPGSAGAAFSPTDIDNFYCWFDFSDTNYMFVDDGVTPVSSDMDFLYRVNDKAGGSVRLKQTGGTQVRPQYKLNLQNGFSSMYFASNNNRTITADTVFSMANTDDTSIFVVYSLNTIYGNHEQVWSTANGGSSTGYLLWCTIGQKMQFNQYVTIVNPSFTGIQMVNIITTASDSQAYVNSDLKVSTGTDTRKNADLLRISGRGDGANYKLLAGDYVCEFLYYKQALSDTDRQSIETYLNDKWEIY